MGVIRIGPIPRPSYTDGKGREGVLGMVKNRFKEGSRRGGIVRVIK